MNKTEMTQMCQSILHSTTGIVRNMGHAGFLLALLAKHPHFRQKVGIGISHFYVDTTPYGNKCFFIHRTDGTFTDFSYIQCIKGAINPLSDIKTACRHAIKEKVIQAKRLVRFGVDKCPITGDTLLKDDTHIDHYNLTFAELFNLWIKDKDIDTLYKATNYQSQDMSMETFFTDPSIADDFATFHDANTHLRAVSSIANLSILRK